MDDKRKPIIDIEYIKYLKDKYKIDCFYIDKNFEFYYIAFCDKCGDIMLKSIDYKIENFSENLLNEIYSVLDDNNIDFIDFFTNKLDMQYFCKCNNENTIYNILYK